ncbi:MAG: phosphate ABC transporter substrate-binding protein [Candidatus Omnitrophica bacterium]|nr:phosphate ABC transporter substrate-binding protein [Candidatus Omnitrophota bacterium]
MNKIIVAIALTACAFLKADVYASGSNITMKGSTTVFPISQKTSETFMQKNPDINISVQGGGSSVGIASIIDGTADIGQSSRPIKTGEIEKAVARSIEPVVHVIAMDGIAVITNASNAINDITTDQIKDIYTGKLSNWQSVGVAGGKIIVVSRDSSSGTYEAFSSKVLAGARTRPDSLLQASNQAVMQTVSTTPGAIGYVGLGYISDKVKALKVNGVECSKKNVLTEKYPISRPLFMYTNGKPKGPVKEYIDFVLSDEGQSIIEGLGFVRLDK